jgi:hypothetical protein
MSELSLPALERDVDAARSRFADSLTVLASPDSYSEAVEAAKRDARGLTRRVEGRIRSSAEGYLDELKARAAANPAAVLAVAAGVAWRLFQKPPIATALVGAGLYSLLRTTPEDFGDIDRIDYTARAGERLREQMTDARDTVLEKAGEVATAAREKVGELAGEAASAATSLAQSTGETIGKLSADASERAASASTEGVRLARDRAARGVETARETLVHSARAISDNRDQALLGLAGVAVAAAIGVALNRRMEE